MDFFTKILFPKESKIYTSSTLLQKENEFFEDKLIENPKISCLLEGLEETYNFIFDSTTTIGQINYFLRKDILFLHDTKRLYFNINGVIIQNNIKLCDIERTIDNEININFFIEN
jgi:hypothetical protein